jgi:type I restriction enzyme S subunit
MSAWSEVALGDILRVRHGFAFKGEYFESEGDQLVLTPGNFKIGGGLQQRSGKERFYSGPYPDEFRLKAGDLLVAMTDLTQESPILGSPLVVPLDGVFLHNQRLGKVEILNDSLLDHDFAYYLFSSDVVRSQLRGSATGSTVRHTAPGRIYTAKVHLPPISTQRKIAAILSAYDDLIENNNRRIKLLEEMAQRIYREWFVDFRYPGHEAVALVDSELGPVPVGWTVARMDQVADVIDCLHSKKPSETQNGEGILLQLFNIGDDGLIELSQIFRIAQADYKQWTIRIELQGGDCVITNVGRIAAVGQIPPGLKAAPGRNMTAIRPRNIPPTYLLQYLLSDHMEKEVHRKKDAGSIMDALNVKGIVKLAVLIPADALVTKFEEICRPIRRSMEVLARSQHKLRSARDQLLPRLVSGKIDVNDLDIAVPEAAA